MNKNKSVFLAVSVSLAIIIILSCSVDNDLRTRNYEYCVFFSIEKCTKGPFEVCAEGGTLSNNCPYEFSGNSSSEIVGSSSSSERQNNSSGNIEISSSSNNINISCGGYNLATHFCDYRDGKLYKYVIIGTQNWMAENLNYRGIEPNIVGRCARNDTANCTKDGRMYDWAETMLLAEWDGCNSICSCNSNYCNSLITEKHQGVCPIGWHIPTQTEWITLINFVGGNPTAEVKLKAENGWANKSNGSSGNGTNEFGFNALPVNDENSTSSDFNVSWWSATEFEEHLAFSLGLMSFVDGVLMSDGEGYPKRSKWSRFHTRCIKD